MSIWKKLGIVAAFMTATTALIGGLQQLGIVDIVQKYLSKEPIVETKSLTELPFSLKNQMGLHPFLYWFHIEVDNRSSENLNLIVTFKVRKGPARVRDVPARYSIPARETFHEHVDPAFVYLRHDFDEDIPLEITWQIQDDRSKILKQGTQTTLLLPKNIVKWDLATPEGNPVPKDFLLASLTAWTLSAETLPEERRARLRQSVDPSISTESLARQWIALCYDGLFGDPSGLRIMPSRISFPPPDRQRIRTPSQAREANNIDPIEAALLLAALSTNTFEEIGARLVLLAVPEPQGQFGQKAIFLSWSITPDKWQAVKMASVAEMDFEENEKLATAEVTRLLREEPEILEGINQEKGVLIGDLQSVVALDFAKAAAYFSIRGLP